MMSDVVFSHFNINNRLFMCSASKGAIVFFQRIMELEFNQNQLDDVENEKIHGSKSDRENY
jgi:hypothetical protein